MTRETNVYFPSYWYGIDVVNVIAPDASGVLIRKIFRTPDGPKELF